MKKLFYALIFVFVFTLCLGVTALGAEAPQTYEVSEAGYTVYTDAQYQEVILGVYDGTLENKTIIFGCDILVTLDFVMKNPCDISIDLNGFTYTNRTVNSKSGDFDFQNKNAIIRIKNGTISSTFCVFIFRSTGQLYAQDLNVTSNDECVYRYGDGHSAVVVLKDCNMNATGNYFAVNLNGDCKNLGNGSLYQIEGGEYGGIAIYCPADGSYVRDCTVYEQKLAIDTWHAHGANGSYVQLEVRNVNVTASGGEVYLNDVQISPLLYDCTFQKVNLSNKSGAVILAFTSPTCEKAGTKTKYHNLTSITVDEQYSIDNPALGHKADLENITDLVYENGFINKGVYVCTCERCGKTDVKEAEPSADELISLLGISTSLTDNGICVGYVLNSEAIENYKSFGKTFRYGVVAYVAQDGETDLEPIKNDLSGIANTINTEINSEYEAFEFVLKGFSEKLYDLEIVFGAYVYDGTEIDYVNTEITDSAIIVTQDDYAKTVTYNQIAK